MEEIIIDNKNKLVYIGATFYALIIGLSFLFTKIALKSADAIDILAFRFTASFIAILIPRLFKLIKINYNKDMVKRILPLAIFYPLLFFGFQTFGLEYASSSEAGILHAASPIFTLILATYFLHEKTNLLQKLSVVLSVSGVVYIFIMKGSSFDINNLKGIILLLLSALSFSGYNVLAKVLTKDFTSVELSYIMNFIGFIVFNIMSVIKHLVNGSLGNFFAPIGNFDFLISIIYLGVLSSLVTSLLANYILSYIEASKMSVFSNLGTVISIIAGVVFLNEKIFYYHIIGSILIVGGVIGANFLGDRKVKNIL